MNYSHGIRFVTRTVCETGYGLIAGSDMKGKNMLGM